MVFWGDRCLKAKYQSLDEAFRKLVLALRDIGLEVNATKSELYSLVQPPPGVLKEIPFISDREASSYIGLPLAEQEQLRVEKG